MRLLLIILLLVSCSTSVSKINTTFEEDSRECLKQSKVVWTSPDFLAPMSRKLAQDKADSLYIECMKSKGYRLKE